MPVREHFDAELNALQAQLRDLGQMTMDAVACAIDLLERDDGAGCLALIDADQAIDQAQQQLEAHAINLIATQQPVARDLRRIMTAITVGEELERIADYAKSVARLVAGFEGGPALSPPAELLQLGAKARDMLRDGLDALERNDVVAARRLAAADDLADALYRQVRRTITAELAAAPAMAARNVDLLFIAHKLERIADRVTNVAERLIYRASGDVVELNP